MFLIRSDNGAQLTHTRASSRFDAFMRASLAAFPAGTTLRQLTRDVDLVCSDDDGAPPTTPVSIRSGSRLVGVEPDQLAISTAGSSRFWKGRGWTVALDQRPDSGYVVMQHPGADYELFMQVSGDRRMISLGGSTPCVPPPPLIPPPISEPG